MDMKIAFLFLVAVLFAACSGQPEVVEPRADANPGSKHRVFETGHGWHTGIVVPAAAINQELPFLRKRFGDAPFYEFGWGDRGFYEAREITVGLAVRAILWPTETVMHVVAVPRPPKVYFPNSDIVEVTISEGGFKSLRQFIANSFYRDGDARTIAFQKGLYGDAQFYKGVGEFYLMNTCNKWTAKALKSAGVDITPTFKLTADSVIESLREP
jgi:uncharacterized protein (TIGR02117 family)